MKVIGVNGSARRDGNTAIIISKVFNELNKEMIIVGSTYWNMVYGKNIGDVLNDDEGMANMCNLGKNMGAIIKMIFTSKYRKS